MDRPPEDPAEQPEPEAPGTEGPPSPARPAGAAAAEPPPPEEPSAPEPPPTDEPSAAEPPPPADDVAPEAPPAPARPYAWTPPSPEGAPALGVPPSMEYAPAPPAPSSLPPGQANFDVPPTEEKDGRPGVGPGVATGCGLQVLAVILFFLTAGLIPSFFGALWPFILFTLGAALLMLSRRWRRFATGALIVSAATWIVVLGPCIALLNGFSM